jgi:ribosome-associated protein
MSLVIKITPNIAIEENEIEESFIRASGPGGQKLNKTATAVQLRFDVANSPSLPNRVRERLMRLAGNRLTDEGELIIEARQFRTQEQNRQDARARLVKLIRQATRKPKTRRKTSPTAASQERRLQKKRRRSEIKRRRQPPDQDW